MSKSPEVWCKFLDFTQRTHLGLLLIFFQLKKEKILIDEKYRVIYLSIPEEIGCHNVRILLSWSIKRPLKKSLFSKESLLSLAGAVYFIIPRNSSLSIMKTTHPQSFASNFSGSQTFMTYCGNSNAVKNPNESRQSILFVFSFGIPLKYIMVIQH